MTVFMLSFVIAVSVIICIFLSAGSLNNLCFCSDEDMKIADGNYSPNYNKDNDDGFTSEFLKNRDNGNIQAADKLGIRYGEVLVNNKELIISGYESGLDDDVLKQMYILFSFTVKAIAEDYSPNPAVSQKITASFYGTVEKLSEPLYDIINDSFTLSFYILWKRNKKTDSEPVGSVFAKVLNKSSNDYIIELGNRLFINYYDFCSDIFKQTSFN